MTKCALLVGALVLLGCQEQDSVVTGYYLVEGSYVPFTSEIVHEKCVESRASHRFDGYAIPQLMMVKVAVGPDAGGQYLTPERIHYDGDTIRLTCPAQNMEAIFVASP